MALDHYVSQVHLKNFYDISLGDRMHAIKKVTGAYFKCNAYSQCRIDDHSTTTYLKEPRAIEDFLKNIEPKYNTATEKLYCGKIDQECIHTIVGFIAFISCCTPASIRLAKFAFHTLSSLQLKTLEKLDLLPKVLEIFGDVKLTQLLDDNLVKINIDGKYPQAVGISTIYERMSVWGNSRWEIIINNYDDSPFFTSDNPLVIEHIYEGAFNRIIPLTPMLAVRLCYVAPTIQMPYNSNYDDFTCSRYEASRNEILNINKLIVQCAEDIVYFSNNLSWVANFIGKHATSKLEAVSNVVKLSSNDIVEIYLKITK